MRVFEVFGAFPGLLNVACSILGDVTAFRKVVLMRLLILRMPGFAAQKLS